MTKDKEPNYPNISFKIPSEIYAFSRQAANEKSEMVPCYHIKSTKPIKHPDLGPAYEIKFDLPKEHSNTVIIYIPIRKMAEIIMNSLPKGNIPEFDNDGIGIDFDDIDMDHLK